MTNTIFHEFVDRDGLNYQMNKLHKVYSQKEVKELIQEFHEM